MALTSPHLHTQYIPRFNKFLGVWEIRDSFGDCHINSYPSWSKATVIAEKIQAGSARFIPFSQEAVRTKVRVPTGQSVATRAAI